jgi:hypothetical protein
LWSQLTAALEPNVGRRKDAKGLRTSGKTKPQQQKDEGMKALSTAIACGALAKLKSLMLPFNQIGD